MPLIVIQALVFAAVILIVGALTSARSAHKEFVRQVFEAAHTNRTAKPRSSIIDQTIIMARKAGMKSSNPEIILMLFGVIIASYITSYLLFGSPYVAVITTPAGIFIFYNIVNSRIKNRAIKMSDDMEDWLLVLASHLKSGVSLAQAIKLSLDRIDDPLRDEVEGIVKAIEFGNTAKDALELYEDRIPAVEYKMVTVAVNVNTALGGNLAEAFIRIAATIAERRRIRGEAKSLSSQGKLASNAIALVIVGLICALRIMSPTYLDPFFETSLGTIIFAGAIGWAVLGWWLVRKVSAPAL